MGPPTTATNRNSEHRTWGGKRAELTESPTARASSGPCLDDLSQAPPAVLSGGSPPRSCVA
ncbi:hypothetical protein B0H17DRAFT_1100374 [Mycena rosella]|uniref:Uncharacterized protein n=1 Tax=Mycena rosella TaxID=1033263 RepID=A0AAD7CMP6_MYCRO|nr:hypothetical protein B0H17DRAFT_1100374 [Mycena rosella]